MSYVIWYQNIHESYVPLSVFNNSYYESIPVNSDLWFRLLMKSLIVATSALDMVGFEAGKLLEESFSLSVNRITASKTRMKNPMLTQN